MDITFGFPSLLSHLLQQDMQHPAVMMYQLSTLAPPVALPQSTLELIHTGSFPCDLVLLNLRAQIKSANIPGKFIELLSIRHNYKITTICGLDMIYIYSI